VAARITSSHPERYGWYTAPVTVTFTCTRGGERVAKCRPPVRLIKSGANQLVAGHRINIDLGAPTLRIGGLTAGATYLISAPTPKCLAQDSVSGIRSCRITERAVSQGVGAQALTFTARAVNKAGTVTVRSITVAKQQPGLIGPIVSATGVYVAQSGQNYTLQVASRIRPLYVEGAVAPQLPKGAHNWFVRSGHHAGLPLWELTISLPTGLPATAYWNVGVQIGTTVRVISLRD
jgi:hypothetical protein